MKHFSNNKGTLMRTYSILPMLLLLVASTVLSAEAMPREQFMRAMALVNWTEVIPQAKYTEDTLPAHFDARVKKAGKLQSLGLPVHIGDIVQLDQEGPYIWSVTKGEQSIGINTYDIPAEAYPGSENNTTMRH